MSPYKLVIFDFDGTLADSFPYVLSIMDQLADEYRFQRVDKSEIETLRSSGAGQLIKRYRVPIWKIARIGNRVRGLMAENIHQIARFDGVDRLLQVLSAQGIQLAILTTNSCENVRRVLGAENAALIRYYECGVSIFGKPAKIRKLLRKSGVSPQEALCIGDEIRDLEAARRVKVTFGAVSWGYTRIEALQAHSPDHVFTSVDQIVEEIF